MNKINNPDAHESIAILGWGSIIWAPPDSCLTENDRLKMPGCWHSDGPLLPMEFARIDEDGRLVLAIDTFHGKMCPVFYTLSGCTSMSDAIEDLRRWEKLPDVADIDFVQKGKATDEAIHAIVANWLVHHNFDAAIWIGARSNFTDITGMPFTVDNAVHYLDSLEEEHRTAAYSYLSKVPECMDTPVRQAASPNLVCGTGTQRVQTV